MSQADNWLDRRNLRRKVGFWRMAAVVLALLAGAFGFAYANGGFKIGKSEPHIAKIRIEGTITEDEKLMALLRDAGDEDAVKGIILSIDSPGGTTVGGEAIYEAVRVLARKKPVVAQVGTLAASAGYMIASATDHIVARKTSIVGSIGVLFQYPDVSQLLTNVGVKYEAIKSSPLKAEPNFFTPASEEAKSMIRRMIMDSYDWFVSIVDERRPLDRTQTLALADGSVFTGRQALQNKLIDSIGGEEKAIEWLNAKGVDKKLKVLEWKPKAESTPWWLSSHMSDGLFKLFGAKFGLENDANGLIGPFLRDHLMVNGLVSLWNVDSSANERN
jgi:protease IV